MTSEAVSATDKSPAVRHAERRLLVRYILLTAALFVPLLLSFVFVRNVYPVAVWKVMLIDEDSERGRAYFILRGETLSGETIDIAPVGLTVGMYARTWWMVGATAENKSFKLRSLYPDNARLLAEYGGVERLPRGARVPELLRAWGTIYNERLAADSPRRLRAIRLDAYRWNGVRFADYDEFVESWRAEL